MKTRRNSRIAAAALGGAATAFVILSMPVGFLETLVASSGLSEAWPAAAPPLGMKAKLLLAAFGMVMAVGLIGTSHREGEGMPGIEEERGLRVQGAGKMGFALSKLGWLARGRRRTTGRGWTLRRADAHPDAPPRTPIFASRDFSGLDIFSTGSKPHDADDARPLPLLVSPAIAEEERAAADSLMEAIDAEFEEIDDLAVEEEVRQRPSVYALSIPELTARFEQGLARRKRAPRSSADISVLADMPVEPPVPVRESVDEEIDEALRSALGTLRSMAGRR